MRKLKLIGTTLVACGTLVATGCTTLPGDSAPEVISSYSPMPDVEDVVEPKDNQPSDLLLRDFFAASAHPVSDYAAARKFLTTERADQWHPERKTKVLDRVFINSDGAVRDGKITYRVRGNVLGTLSPGGVFTPEFTGYETTYEMVQERGQWRISNLRDAVVLDRADFFSAYEARDLYFVNPRGSMLVPDRRWMYTRQQSIGASMVSLLNNGPNPLLGDAVNSLIPPMATVRTQRTGEGEFEVEFTGLTGLNPEARRLLGAQVVWTLAGSDVRGPYRLIADGTLLSEEVGETWRVNDVSEFDPRASAAGTLRAVSGGQVRELSESDADAVAMGGWLASNYIDSLAVSAQENMFAAVAGMGERPRRLLVGKSEGAPQELLESKSLTRPTWSGDAHALYTVADGQEIKRFVRSSRTGNLVEEPVDAESVERLGPDARISMFRISRDGVRAALLIDGKVYVAVLHDLERGGVRLGKLEEIGYQMGDTAVSVGWQHDGTLLVGTRANDAPVWHLAVDGSMARQESARNIAAPVVAVASTAQAIYATDGRALVMLNRDDSDPKYWREVPGLVGQRAIPVVAH